MHRKLHQPKHQFTVPSRNAKFVHNVQQINLYGLLCLSKRQYYCNKPRQRLLLCHHSKATPRNCPICGIAPSCYLLNPSTLLHSFVKFSRTKFELLFIVFKKTAVRKFRPLPKNEFIFGCLKIQTKNPVKIMVLDYEMDDDQTVVKIRLLITVVLLYPCKNFTKSRWLFFLIITKQQANHTNFWTEIIKLNILSVMWQNFGAISR